MRPGPLAPVLACALLATPAEAGDAPRIAPGAVALGVAGSLLSTDGTTRVDLGLRAGPFVKAGPGLLAPEGALDYGRIRELDRLDLRAGLSWVWLPASSPLFPFVGLTAGVRQEWLGSFSNALGSWGGTAGVHALFSRRAALRVEYGLTRFLDDPGPDFVEHRLAVGVSVLFRNE